MLLYHGRNYWNFAKGKLEKEERSWQAALREVAEESGLRASELRMLRNFKTTENFSFGRGKSQIFKVVILYLAETKKRDVTVSWEHEGYGWFTIVEAKRILAKYPENVRIIQKAYDFLKKGSKGSIGNTQGPNSDVQKSSETSR